MPIRTVERGEGPLLVCLHGIGSSSHAFERQLEGLSAQMRVVAWDAPGYGDSPDVDLAAGDGIGPYAEEAAALVAKRGGRGVLLGVSWGGVIAIEVARRHPDLLNGLVLVSASRGSGRSEEARRAMERRSAELDEVGAQEVARRRAPRLLSAGAPPALVADVERSMAAALRSDGYRRAIRAMAATDHSPVLGSIATPTLVLCGSADEVTGVAEGEALARGIPGAALVVLDGVGHLLNQEAPEAANAWVASFVGIVTQAAGARVAPAVAGVAP